MAFEKTSSPQYSQFIHLSKYARWIDALNRRETWEETVQRFIDFMRSIAPGMPWDEIQQAILNLEIMPSMRALMTAGPALERDNAAGYNPVIGSTRIVTKEYGNVAIESLEGHSVTVLNRLGNWADATIHCYGNRPTAQVVLRLNSNTVKTVECSQDHRWVLSDGTVKSTETLRVGDKIPFAAAPKAQEDSDYILGVRHGLVYGDGTAVKDAKRVKGFMIRLCGQSAELLRFFDGYSRSYPASANGDPIVFLYDGFSACTDLKELPSNETESYVLGFIRGWLAADGSVSKTSQVSLCTHQKGLSWLQDNAERAGFVLQSVYKQSALTNYGKRNQDSYVVKFSRSSMVSEDFLCSWKRDLFRPLESHYVVSDVTSTNQNALVYCAEVPEDNTFTIEGGLVTGNCCFLAVDHPRAFDEALYLLACGCGVGFSVEKQFVRKLPEVAETFATTPTTIVVRDSKIGWAEALKQLISLLYAGQIPTWDMSKVRPKGARLKTFGGRASGPEPLHELFTYTVNLFQSAAGRKLRSLECHDLMCKIATCIIVGGVRRSAMISLSDPEDDRMRTAKSGAWWEQNVQRAYANNSATYNGKPDPGFFLKEWHSLYESKSGERGIFNREAATKVMPERRDKNHFFGCNPCSEIILRPNQMCNLTEIIARPDDTEASLKRKAELAAMLGTVQSTLTNFRYLRSIWKKNCEEERLLGVSVTGIMDNLWLRQTKGEGELLRKMMKQAAIDTNAYWADKLGIARSAAITTVKPSGTVSQLVDSASGIHARFAPYYLRRVRSANTDPLARMLIDQGVPYEVSVTNKDDYVFAFPMKAPKGAVCVRDVDALRQLEIWKAWQLDYCEHKPSQTVYYNDKNFVQMGAWVYENFDIVSGISFLPHSEHSYQQAPYEEITKSQYEDLLAKMPCIDWSKLAAYELEDATTGTQEYACAGGACEIL